MYNEADFVVSLLNSDNDTVKRDVDKMCKMSSNNKQIELNYDSFNNQVKTPIHDFTFKLLIML